MCRLWDGGHFASASICWEEVTIPITDSDLTFWGQNQPSLVQIIACRLVGAKPLSEPMLEYS